VKSVEFRREREAGWHDLERLVRIGEAEGLASLSPGDLERLPALYRAALSALSVTRAFALDANLRDYLESLSARAYFLVYANKSSVWVLFVDFLRRDFPCTFRRSARLLLVAAALLLLGALCGFTLTWQNPESYYAFVPEGLAQGRTPAATTEALRKVLYDRGADGDILLAFAMALFTHNAQVGLLAAGLGFVAGLPTALLLFTNGTILGAFGALYDQRGLGPELWAWILPHGITELLSLVVCGAAGLGVAASLLFPGRVTRLDSLKQRGRDVACLVVGAVGMDLVAGLIEGIFRQSVQDPTVRLTFAASSAVAWVLYLGLAGREQRA